MNICVYSWIYYINEYIRTFICENKDNWKYLDIRLWVIGSNKYILIFIFQRKITFPTHWLGQYYNIWALTINTTTWHKTSWIICLGDVDDIVVVGNTSHAALEAAIPGSNVPPYRQICTHIWADNNNVWEIRQKNICCRSPEVTRNQKH